jgi:hypothetical protein
VVIAKRTLSRSSRLRAINVIPVSAPRRARTIKIERALGGRQYDAYTKNKNR